MFVLPSVHSANLGTFPVFVMLEMKQKYLLILNSVLLPCFCFVFA